MTIYSHILLLLVSIIISISNIFAANYPKTSGERRAEEMGSIDALIFRPKRIQNDSTKDSVALSVNKYLWQAALKILKQAPLASADSNSGVIITDWYAPKTRQNVNFKINIFIKDDVIAPNSIEVRVFQQKSQGGKTVVIQDPSNFANALENQILQEARNLYINNQKKK